MACISYGEEQHCTWDLFNKLKVLYTPTAFSVYCIILICVWAMQNTGYCRCESCSGTLGTEKQAYYRGSNSRSLVFDSNVFTPHSTDIICLSQFALSETSVPDWDAVEFSKGDNEKAEGAELTGETRSTTSVEILSKGEDTQAAKSESMDNAFHNAQETPSMDAAFPLARKLAASPLSTIPSGYHVSVYFNSNLQIHYPFAIFSYS